MGVNVPLIVAGSLALLGAAVHGVGGEVLVVRKLLAAYARSPRLLFLHPAPAVPTATAALAWWGAL